MTTLPAGHPSDICPICRAAAFARSVIAKTPLRTVSPGKRD